VRPPWYRTNAEQLKKREDNGVAPRFHSQHLKDLAAEDFGHAKLHQRPVPKADARVRPHSQHQPEDGDFVAA